MATQVLNLKAAGLETFYQTLMETSPGALLKANNTVINRSGIIEPRRGFKAYSDTYFNQRINKLFEYKDTVIAHSDNNLYYDSGNGVFTQFTGTYPEVTNPTAKTITGLSLTSGSTTIGGFTSAKLSNVNIGDYVSIPSGSIPANTFVISKNTNSIIVSNPIIIGGTGLTLSFFSSSRMQSVESKGNFYFTASSGVKKIAIKNKEAYSTIDSNTIRDAGVPKALCPKYERWYTGSGFLPEEVTTTPAQVQYSFFISPLSIGNEIYAGAVYSNNSQSFTFSSYYENGTSVIVASGTGAPSVSGTLTKVSGNGPSTVTFASTSSTSLVSTYCAYKVLWIYTDRTDNLTFGAPSDRLVVVNEASNNVNTIKASIRLTFPIPIGINTTEYSYRIYRSELSTSSPSDELSLVAEVKLAQADITAGSISYVDNVLEAQRVGGVPLYTNQNSGEGILKANELPPKARDLALFKGHVFYANTKRRSSKLIKLNKFTTSPQIPISYNPPFTEQTYFVISNKLNSETTYQFQGSAQRFRLTFGAGSTFNANGLFQINGPDGNKYKIYISNLDKFPQIAPLFAEDGSFYYELNIANATTNTSIATSVFNILNGNIAFLADFSISLSSNQITITSKKNGNCPVTSITGITYTLLSSGTGEDIANKKILLSSNPDTTKAIEETLQSLVRVVNGNASELVRAYYISTGGDNSGQVFFENKDIDASDFYLGIYDTTSGFSGALASNFSPKLGTLLPFPSTVIDDTCKSDSEVVGNRLYWSKYQEHEAVPFLNYQDIGSKDQEILRIISLRESIFIFKADGVYRLAGDPGPNPVWDVGPLDLNSVIKAPESAVTLANSCYFLSNQGVTKINETGLEIISKPIEDKIVPFLSTNIDLFHVSFSVGYESDRALHFWTVLNKTDQKATVCYRYSLTTNAWTEWKISKTCALLNGHEDKLYLADAADDYIEVERKNLDRFDYADREYYLTLPADSLNQNIIKTTGFSLYSVEDVVIQEQYLTIYQFNKFLKQLDLDPGLSVNDFYAQLKMNPGDNLSAKMTLLAAKLTIADPITNYNALWTNPSDFPTIQTQFNSFVNALNSSFIALFNNYPLSTGTVKYECIVSSLDDLKQEITLNQVPVFMQGPLTLYKGIKTEIEYAPQHAGEPASFKQYSVGTLLFERKSFYTAQVGYKSDISDSYEEISFNPNSSGVFGVTEWGNNITWGGQGDQGQIRTFIPLKKQRCRFLGCKFTHGVALESFQLYGLSLSIRAYAIPDRDYK